MNKRYVAPLMTVTIVEFESGIVATSVALHIENNRTIQEEWEESEVVFDPIEW